MCCASQQNWIAPRPLGLKSWHEGKGYGCGPCYNACRVAWPNKSPPMEFVLNKSHHWNQQTIHGTSSFIKINLSVCIATSHIGSKSRRQVHMRNGVIYADFHYVLEESWVNAAISTIDLKQIFKERKKDLITRLKRSRLKLFLMAASSQQQHKHPPQQSQKSLGEKNSFPNGV